MSTKEATPLWIVHGKAICEEGSDWPPVLKDRAAPDSVLALIVRHHNAHDALVALARAVVNQNYVTNGLQEQARQALKLAETEVR